jgi:hypothetical protein
MKEQEKIDLIRFMLKRMKETERELLVFRAALGAIALQYPQMESALNELVESCRKSEEVDKRLGIHFAGFEGMIENIGEDSLEKLVREFQEKFGSKLPIH